MGAGRLMRRMRSKRAGSDRRGATGVTDKQRMVSIWDSGIEYGKYKYNTVYSNYFGFDRSENKAARKLATLEGVTIDEKPPQQRSRDTTVIQSKPVVDTTGSEMRCFVERRQRAVIAPTWNEFTRSTTFHGVRFVFDEKNVPAKNLRRVLWVLCVLAAVTLFLVQVYDRAQDYFQYKTNTNVEVIYGNDVIFPSVTICNSNSYRLTETVSRGLYNYLDAVYSNQQNVTANLLLHSPGPEVNLTQFILETAHQKEDFFDSCTWKGQPCNMTADLQTIVTDFGVCYTFNSRENRTLSQAGSGFALSLVLNIEQYEYMKGPQDEAGVKVLLHDSSETPLVKELGFAIAPGTHTLVAVRRSVIETLESPWGECVEGSVPRSQCLAECKRRYVEEKCGCHNPGMGYNNRSDVCTMGKSFTCVRSELDKFTRSGQGCVCHIPCYRVTYEAELSYAHLSKLNIDRISLSDARKREKVENSYRDAREVAQRVDPATARRDNDSVRKVLNETESYMRSLDAAMQVLQLKSSNPSAPVIPVLESNAPVFLADFALIHETYNEKARVITSAFPNLSFFTLVSDRLHGIIYESTGERQFSLYVERCAAAEETGVPIDEDNVYHSCVDRGQSTTTLLSKKREQIRQFGELCQAAILKLGDLDLNYRQLMRYLYGGTNEYQRRNDTMEECLNNLQNISVKWQELMGQMSQTASAYVSAVKWVNKLALAQDLNDYLNYTRVDSNQSLAQEDFTPCNWFLISPSEITADQVKEQFQVHSDSAVKAYYDARGMLTPLLTECNLTSTHLRSQRHFLFSPLIDFLARNSSKTHLREHLQGDEFQAANQQLSTKHTRFSGEFNAFLSKVTSLENNLRESVRLAHDVTVPVLNRSLVLSLQLVRFARTHENHSESLGRALDELSRDNVLDTRDVLDDVIMSVYGEYRKHVQAIRTNSTHHFQALQSSLQFLQADLDHFVQGNHIDESFFMENFIKMEIFYSELSHERIRQQEAFELLSLVSEIGGFLGLLLGASVLTVCELVDFLALAGLSRCHTARYDRYRVW